MENVSNDYSSTTNSHCQEQNLNVLSKHIKCDENDNAKTVFFKYIKKRNTLKKIQ